MSHCKINPIQHGSMLRENKLTGICPLCKQYHGPGPCHVQSELELKLSAAIKEFSSLHDIAMRGYTSDDLAAFLISVISSSYSKQPSGVESWEDCLHLTNREQAECKLCHGTSRIVRELNIGEALELPGQIMNCTVKLEPHYDYANNKYSMGIILPSGARIRAKQ